MRKRSLVLLLALCLLLSGCAYAVPTGSPMPEPTMTPTPIEAAVPTPSAAPTPVPTPEPTPEPSFDALPHDPVLAEGPAADEAYFADAVFFGNSMIMGLGAFGGLEQASFIASTSASVVNVVKMKPEEPADAEDAMLDLLCAGDWGKIYIELGVNEIGFEPEYFVELYGALLDRIEEAQPDAEIVLMGLTPVTAKKDAAGPTFSRERVEAYNAALLELAAERGCWYLDVTEPLAGEDGFLAETESLDGIHPTKEKYPLWADWIRTHTPPERSPAAAEAEALSAPQLPKLPARERVDDAYFDGAVFFGNSLVAGLSQYGGLDRADFLASVGVNVADARIALLPGAAEGSGITMFQVLVGRPREKLYTLFGINEMGFEPDYFATLYESLIDAALAVQPELTIYITSLSPLTEERCGWDTVYTMEKITAYNEALYALAARRGWYYLDLMDALAGPDGYLPAEISTDGVHLTPEGYLIWADYLRTHYAD